MGRSAARWLALLAIAVLVGCAGLAARPSPAAAIPQYAHGPAQACASCHHDKSFQKCSTCHTDVSVPNQACVKCHPGKTTTGEACWDTCHVPGAPQPTYADEECALAPCHGPKPHLAATANCTSCHPAAPPTAHHDGKSYQTPTCKTCHPTVPRHDGQDCAACHSLEVHPDIPNVPAVCNRCHSSAVFNGRGNCLDCHSGQKPFAGKTNNDVHNASIPDAPISAYSCRSCHPQAQKHAGSVGCLTCHAQADAFHHGTSSTPGYPDCTQCHANQTQHGSGLACNACHAGAQHQTSPPTPPATVCNTCHPASQFGQGGCYRCHGGPIYHGDPAVGTCSSCHGGGRETHAGTVSCRTCHTNTVSGHHLGGIVIPSCMQTGCHAQQKHVGTVSCAGCHGAGASHSATPLNLPTDTWSVCGQCHTFATKATVAAIGPCSTCHDSTYHSATYRVASCASCHAGKLPHADVVTCRLCHVNIGGGHHAFGNVGAKLCSTCHVDTQVHASATAPGAAFGCSTCHEGSVHGRFSKPTGEMCVGCHLGAEEHSAGNACVECHWKAAHAARPDPGELSRFEKMPVLLPAEPTTPPTTAPTPGTPPSDPADPSRPGLVNTGVAVGLLGASALVLLVLGIGLRAKGRGGSPT